MENKNKFYKLSNDKVFKILFVNPKNKEFLKRLLEKVLDVKITNIEYLGTEKYPDSINNKDMRLDCLVDTSLGIIEIEMNSYNNFYVRIRNSVFMFKIICEHYEVGDKYTEDTMFIQINFTNGLGSRYKPIEVYKLQTDDHKEFIKNLRIYEVNLDYYEKYWLNNDIENIRKNYLFVMFNRNEEELDKLMDICEESKEFAKMVKKVNKEYHNIFTVREDEERIHNTLMEEAKTTGFNEGIEKGEKNKITELIINMLHNNFTIEQIKLATNMTEEYILEIKKNIKL